MKHLPCPVALALTLAAGVAAAHITLEDPNAQAGAAYKAVLRVGHGCKGSATHTLTVRLPAGFRGAKPMPKAGWTLDIRREAGAEVSEISWKAASREAWLPDSQYDEFVLRGLAPAQAGPIWFKVLQQCEQGQWDWAEVPSTGSSIQGLRAPAVLLNVQPAEPAAAAPHVH